jgi:NADPH-dependent 2,4-dienoyl-CoA reductase/sulfur reductase-like enzyme
MIAVVGAGPAGESAARAAARAGARVVLIDSAPHAGGQYRRGRRRPAPGVEHLFETTVWAVENGGLRLHLRTGPADSPDRTGRVLDADAVVLATGAHDRALPFPGWALPGVVTAGAAQALAKDQHTAVGSRVVVAGTGPFLLPVATSLLRVGADVVAVLEAGNPLAGWAREPRAVLAGRAKLGELAGYLAVLARHRVPYRTRTTVVAAHGDTDVREVTTARLDSGWRIVSGTARLLAADAVCVGFGFTPRLELAVAAGCRLRGGFVAVDERQATSAPGVHAAGEITGVGGADLAAAEGAVAGLAAAGARPPESLLAAVRRGRAFAAGLDRAHAVRPGWRTWLTADTVVCRCEEVTLADLRAHDVLGVRSLKLRTRAGLGQCQGRVCGRNAAELAGPGFRADPVAASRRPIATPLRLGELATTPLEDEG